MKTLIEQFNSLSLPEKEYAILPLGQHSFVVKTKNKTIWLDPFLTDLEGRNVPVLCRADEVCVADIITGSHDHADHIDRAALPDMVKAAKDAVFVFPRAVSVGEVPAERTSALNDSETIELDGVKITAVASAHELLETDSDGNFTALGFVIECDGIKFYHSGDCCIYEGLQTKLRALAPYDFAFLPINGRDAVRYKANCIGNMTYQEAVDLAGALDINLTIPAHFDMFTFNSTDPTLFADYFSAKYPGRKYSIPIPGKIIRGTAR